MTQEELQTIRAMMEEVTQASEKRMGQMMDERFEAERKHTSQMMDEKLEPIKTQMDEMQEDITHIKEQVDIAYNWVDRIDLRVKALEKG